MSKKYFLFLSLCVNIDSGNFIKKKGLNFINHSKLVEKANKKLFKDEEPNIKIGATIKIKRKEQNKTLSEVSERAGVSLSFISKIENDQIKANLDHIKGILDDLDIKENIFQVSQDMNRWYEDLLDYQLDLSNPSVSFKDVTEQRDDFQSKLIELAVDIKKGFFGNSEKNITLLITAMDNMKPIEVAIFLLIVSEYYIQTHELFKAADLLSIVFKKEFVHVKVDLWLYEIIFKLAICSKNEHYITKVFIKLQEMYIIFNLYGKSAEKRMEYIKHCTYIHDEMFFKKLMSFDDDIEHHKSQLLNLYLSCKMNKLKVELDSIKNQSSYQLVFAIYYDETKQLNKAETMTKQLETHPYDSPIETFYKNYLIAKYITLTPDQYLKSILGQKGPFYYNTAVIELALEYYIEWLADNHRYKECTHIMKMINTRLCDIQKNLQIF